ncbi:PUA-like domain-containing protein [Globomyces pollinis-pini]|nr:PUA-like domain-containing protein [Globomyces pollinis-pini]
MPCGMSVCKRCFRLPKKLSIAQYSLKTYQCPAKCNRNHHYKNENINFRLHSILFKLFPIQQSALALCHQAEMKLDTYWNATDCQNACGLSTPYTNAEKLDDIHQIIVTYLDKAIEASPSLQLPYIIRSKAYAEVGDFTSAFQDASTATELNCCNKRGPATHKLITAMQTKALLLEDANSYPSPTHMEYNNGKSNAMDFLTPIDITPTCIDLVTACKPKSRSSLVSAIQSYDFGDMECQLCLDIMDEPVTSPCGHSWCRNCILDSLSYSRCCPLCRTYLPSFGYFNNRPTDNSLCAIKNFYFPAAGQTRKEVHLKDGSFAPKKIPLFICSLTFPCATEQYHIFEPRYRALVKKCLESDKQFGIILPSKDRSSPCAEFGTVVRISHHESIASGELVETNEGLLPRFIIETEGLYRFKTLSVEENIDGYMEAVIERIEDIEPEDKDPNWDHESLERLESTARTFVNRLISSVPVTARLHFERKHGIMPTDIGDFSFWLAGILPLNPYISAQLLPLTCVSDRLKLICDWISRATTS